MAHIFKKKKENHKHVNKLTDRDGGTIALVFNGFARWDQNFNVFFDIYFQVTVRIFLFCTFQFFNACKKTSYKTILNNTGVYTYMIKKPSNKTMFFLF